MDNADAKSVPDAAFKAAFDQFQKELKYITVKKLNYFIFENWTKIDKECKEREMNDGSKDDDSQDGQKSKKNLKKFRFIKKQRLRLKNLIFPSPRFPGL